MSDVPNLHEYGAGTSDVRITLELADLHDQGEEAGLEARRRLVRACFVTLIGPMNFLAQALLLWQYGWPPAGAAGFAMVSLIAVVAWLWWAQGWLRASRVRAHVSRRQIELKAEPRPMILTSVLWSTERI